LGELPAEAVDFSGTESGAIERDLDSRQGDALIGIGRFLAEIGSRGFGGLRENSGRGRKECGGNGNSGDAHHPKQPNA
jgi:hypothetical protein